VAEAALRILVVEDHAALGRFITEVLTAAGYGVIGPMANQSATLEALARASIDLAVVDRRLHGEETSAICEALAVRGIGCLLISGYPRLSLQERFRDLPFLEKPFTMEELVAAVNAVTAGPR
jgi:DNA-binding response OmpR family regulator